LIFDQETTMRVKIKLFGTLSKRFPGYRHSEGIEIELPERATVKDLLALLKISATQGAVVVAEGRVLKTDDPIPNEVPVQVLQSIYGG
jgi:sulfur carrier protein ThiS